jgi:hypothetical protein
MPALDPVLCACGCGLPAPTATANRPSRAQVKGQPLRWGHASRLPAHAELMAEVNADPARRARVSAGASTPAERARRSAAASTPEALANLARARAIKAARHPAG